jgi:hypothetical protein
MNKMNYLKRPLVLFFGFTAFIAMIFCTTHVKSYITQPPAFYCNDPNPYEVTLNCTYCHSSFTAFHDSTNFILQIGTDTQSLSQVISGSTTYIPGVTYFLRLSTSSPAAIHGFELTAVDSTKGTTIGSGAAVTNFGILNSTNTALLSPNNNGVVYNFVSHNNATSNNVWTFTWTAPAGYTGPISFYYAGNDGVAGNTNLGDSIFVASKTITWSGISGITDISAQLSGLSVLPTVFDEQVQISFSMKENARVQATVVNMSGQVVKTIFNEGLSPGSFNRNVDLSGLAQGIYMVKVQIGNGYAVSKIVKQ